MNKTKRLASKIGLASYSALFAAFTGCLYAQPPPPPPGMYPPPGPPRAYAPPVDPRVYAQPSPPEAYVTPAPVEASVSVGFPGVEIRAESDFYEPLASYGRWAVVGSYGRCWIPGQVAADWRPYSDGYWQRTDAGWYWASDEPWAWATYHYGRWDLSPEYGWYWVPQTQWAPAWVSWHRGAGYIGWAPLYPSARFARNGSVQVDVHAISPRAYVFVEERHFLEPVRRSTVVVNNTTIINRTVNITNTKVVNNSVINEGPPTRIIEKASGHKVQAVAVREMRHQEETRVLAKQTTPATIGDKRVGMPVRNGVAPPEKKIVVAHVPPQNEKPAAVAHGPVTPAPKNHDVQNQKPQPVTKPAELKPQGNYPPAIKESAPKANQHLEKPVKPSEGKTQATAPPAKPVVPSSSQSRTNAPSR